MGMSQSFLLDCSVFYKDFKGLGLGIVDDVAVIKRGEECAKDLGILGAACFDLIRLTSCCSCRVDCGRSNWNDGLLACDCRVKATSGLKIRDCWTKAWDNRMP